MLGNLKSLIQIFCCIYTSFSEKEFASVVVTGLDWDDLNNDGEQFDPGVDICTTCGDDVIVILADDKLLGVSGAEISG